MVEPSTSTSVSLLPRPKRTSIVLRALPGGRVETRTCVRCGVYPGTDDVTLAWVDPTQGFEMKHIVVLCCPGCAREESSVRWRAPVLFSLAVAAMTGAAALPPIFAMGAALFGGGTLLAGLWQMTRTRARTLVAEGVTDGTVRVEGPGALGEVVALEAPERVAD